MSPAVMIATAVLAAASLSCGRREPKGSSEPSPSPASPASADSSPSPAPVPDHPRRPEGGIDSLAAMGELLGTVRLQALGNEPFWSVEIRRDDIVYRDPERQDGIRFPYRGPVREGEAVVFRSQRGGQAPRSIEVRVEERTCSDGMSDLVYRYASEVRLDGRALKGCARFRP